MTNRPELLLSLGTTAHLVDMTPDLEAAPQRSNDVQRGALFPIEVNRLVLAFARNSFSYGNLRRTLVLTEDGIWGLAPLMSENSRSYFLNELTLMSLAQSAGSKSSPPRGAEADRARRAQPKLVAAGVRCCTAGPARQGRAGGGRQSRANLASSHCRSFW